MSVWRIYEDWVKPEHLDTYEDKVKLLADRAASAEDPLHWAAYGTAVGDAGRFYYAIQAADFAELAARGTSGDLVMRALGQKEAAKWLREVRACLLQEQQTISMDRPELSFSRAPQTSQPYALVTACRIRPDGREAFEEFARKLAESIQKMEAPGALMTRQIIVGDLHEYRLVRPLASLAELEHVTQASDLLNQAFGTAEGSHFFRTGTSAVERVERRVVELRKELSHLPS
jgi:hypothetical protein